MDIKIQEARSEWALENQGQSVDSGTVPTYDPPLDAGIADAVVILNGAGVETFESCEGGDGHAYAEPTVRFHGDKAEGFRALAVAMSAGLPVTGLRRVWPVNDGEPTGPWWELIFPPFPRVGVPASETGPHPSPMRLEELS